MEQSGVRTMSEDVKIAAIKAAPAGALSFFYAWTLQEWIGVLTILYLAMQIIVLLPKFYQTVSSWSIDMKNEVIAKLRSWLL